MKLLLKKISPVPHKNFNSPLEEACELAGIETTYSEADSADFAYFGYNNSYDYYKTLPENLQNKVNLDLLLKSKLNICTQSAGINFLSSQVLTSEESLTQFPSQTIMIKPIEGYLSRTPYTFVYKIIKNDSELMSTILKEAPLFFQIGADGNKECNKYIVQAAFGSSESDYVQTYFVAGYVNGKGDLVTEGIHDNKHSFNQLNDIDDVLYPIRNMRVLALGNTEDNTDKYSILEQLKTLIDFYSIRNTPINSQWIISEEGKAYLIDFAYNFQRSLMYYEEFCSKEFFADKLKFIYDLQPNIELPMTGWVGLVDMIISSDKESTYEYAKNLGFRLVDNWTTIGPQSNIQIFRFTGLTEQECIEKVNLLREYIRNNTPNNFLLF